MGFRFSAVGAALVLTCGVSGIAEAQTDRLHLGPRVSYQFDLEEVGIGVQLGVPIARHLEFYPSFDVFLVDVGSFWNLNADLKYRIAEASVRWLYLGTGINFARSGFNGNHDTRAGLNLFAGAESLRGRVHPFGELRFVVRDGSSAQVAVGLNFTLGRH